MVVVMSHTSSKRKIIHRPKSSKSVKARRDVVSVVIDDPRRMSTEMRGVSKTTGGGGTDTSSDAAAAMEVWRRGANGNGDGDGDDLRWVRAVHPADTAEEGGVVVVVVVHSSAERDSAVPGTSTTETSSADAERNA
jgi:hypothetical protein